MIRKEPIVFEIDQLEETLIHKILGVVDKEQRYHVLEQGSNEAEFVSNAHRVDINIILDILFFVDDAHIDLNTLGKVSFGVVRRG